ncbi:MAG: modulator protein [Rhodospirillaceae bacterium]|nr:modulator protein [Rhodospirillaceae bacterium]HAA93882.1 modulator protein [Rhodospirillaceae bacterium]
MSDDTLERLQSLLKKATALGADAADGVYLRQHSLSHAQRLGEIENLERSENEDLGLRVFVGKQQAVVSSSDQSPDALDALAERAVAMAKAVPEDEFCGLAEPDQLSAANPEALEIFDATEPEAETLIDWAKSAEGAAMAVDGITNSEGAEADWSQAEVALAATNGFTGTYRGSSFSVSACVLAGEGTAMERDYDYATAVFMDDMEDPEEIGRRAGERTIRRLNPRKAESAKVPVVYEPRVSNSMVRHFAGAINGGSIARGISFLKDRMGEKIFSDEISIIDDPHRPRGLASKPFDAEGLANDPIAFIEDGVLTQWVLDLRSARQLGLASNGRASRGTSSPPGPSTTNLHMTAGSIPPDALIGEIDDGFYVTDMMGFGVNGVTGDYSRGASGFWIENGKLADPVSEMTVAGNLKDMFLNLTPANDLEFRYGTNAPTLRIDGMTVAGS